MKAGPLFDYINQSLQDSSQDKKEWDWNAIISQFLKEYSQTHQQYSPLNSSLTPFDEMITNKSNSSYSKIQAFSHH